MAEGLMKRFEEHEQPTPKVVYNDRDCCAKFGQSKYRVLFSGWDLCVRLDVWHFMRRMANGITSTVWPLHVSAVSCYFRVGQERCRLFLAAKRSELVAAGVPNHPQVAVQKAVSKEEMVKHCRRRTRGTKETTDAIEELLLSFSMATDPLGGDEVNLVRAIKARGLPPRPFRYG